MKKTFAFALMLLAIAASAQNKAGGLSDDILTDLGASYQGNAQDKAIRNALNANSMTTLALSAEKSVMPDTHFSHQVKTVGHTDQRASGRCWLFTGLNMLRAQMIAKNNLESLTLSPNYLFFYDQLEKANLFLQGVIDTRKLPVTDRKVDWLFEHPISDGGQFTGVSNLVMKYGVVPADVMPETFASNNTSAMRSQLSLILREGGLRLRECKPQECQAVKVAVLKDVYRVLALCLGIPPKEFTWEGKEYTPQSYYKEMFGEDLNANYIMVMNNPTLDYGKVYEIDYDRHVYDGNNWVYVNLPMDRIKEMAIASIKDNTPMYFSCDVGKCLDRNKGVADLDNYDYESLLGVKCNMDKKERIMTHASGSTHAMTLIAVDIKDEKPVKWMVENSWGAGSGYGGNIIMTDEWFDNYMFRLVLNKKYVPADILKMTEQKPVLLPAWDPMFAPEE